MKRNTKTIKGSTYFLKSKIDSKIVLPLTKNSGLLVSWRFSALVVLVFGVGLIRGCGVGVARWSPGLSLLAVCASAASSIWRVWADSVWRSSLLSIKSGLVMHKAKCIAMSSCASATVVILLLLGFRQQHRITSLSGQFCCTGAILVDGGRLNLKSLP